MDAKELRAKTSAELLDQLLVLRREQFNLRVQLATGEQAKPDQIARTRHDIARLKTVLRERELQNERAGSGR
jgi:large subunit ribosomal protein L29